MVKILVYLKGKFNMEKGLKKTTILHVVLKASQVYFDFKEH